MTLLEWALTYARRGWPVFPCNPKNKRPLVEGDLDEAGKPIPNTGGVKKASTDPAQLEAWWRQYPNAMIGLATGASAGVFVVDIDAGHDEKTGEVFEAWQLLRDLENEIGTMLVPTWRVRTPRGGWHLYFAMPADSDKLATSPGEPTEFLAIGNRAGMVPRVDVRGEGGYVILPPSARPDSAAYVWEVKPAQADDRPSDPPPALVDCILKRGKWEPDTHPHPGGYAADPPHKGEGGSGVATMAAIDDAVRRYVDAAVAGEAAEVARCGKGGRNARLNTAAVKLGGLVAAGVLDPRRVAAVLYQAAEQCGLVGDKDDGPHSVKKTIASGLAHGRKRPTDLSHVTRKAEERARRAGSVVRLAGPRADAPPPAGIGDYFSAQPSHASHGNAAIDERAAPADAPEEAAMPENVVSLADARRKKPPQHGDGDDLIAELAEYPETDLGNTMRFHRRYKGRLIFCRVLGWFYWDGYRWKRQGAEGRVAAAIQETIEAIGEEVDWIAESGDDPIVDVVKGKAVRASDRRQQWAAISQGANHIRCIEELAEHRFEVQSDQLDADPWKFNTLSGTLVIRRHKGDGDPIALVPHDPDDLITKLAPVEYEPEARSPLFDGFLEFVQPAEGMRRFLMQWLGYSLTGDTGEQRLTFHYGKGKNGKSTLMDVIGTLAGDYGATVPIETFLHEGRGRNAGQATPDLAMLPGVRFLRTSEPERGAKLAEALIKLATGGEEMLVRELHRPYFRFYPSFKLSMSGNHKPVIVGTDDGIWRRMMLVPWGVQVEKDKRDKNLPHKLRAELPGILNRMLDGLRDYLDNGLCEPEEVIEATEQYRADRDPLGRFLDTCVVRDAGGRVQSSALHQLFCAWAKANGEREWTAKGFGLAMREKGFQSKNSNVIWWLDIRTVKAVSDFVDADGRPIGQTDGGEGADGSPPPRAAGPPSPDDEVPF